MKLIKKILAYATMLVLIALGVFAVVLSYTSDCEPGVKPAEGTETMKAIVARCYGGPEVLSYEDIAKPVPADNEVLVRVHAAALNPLDYHYMRGVPYIIRMFAGIGKPGDIKVGVDYAGTVESVGKDVTRFKPGDEVFGGRSGALGEYLVVPEDRGITLKPANISFEEAASVAIAGVTALQAVRDKGQVNEGDSVLVNGASGGVGTFAVQIAKAYGASVDGVCSGRNVDMVMGIGADHVFNYKEENFTESDRQYDLMVDMIGNHPFADINRVLKPEGRMVMVGGPKGPWIKPFVRPTLARIVSLFIDQTYIGLLAEIRQDALADLAKLIESGKLRPVIDRRYSLAEAADAMAYQESGRARGKVIIRILD